MSTRMGCEKKGNATLDRNNFTEGNNLGENHNFPRAFEDACLKVAQEKERQLGAAEEITCDGGGPPRC